jgi:TatD DNase family protein
MMVDTHVHLFTEQFDPDREEVFQRARDVGVEKFLLPNIDLPSIQPMLQLSDAHPDVCLPMMGLHPCSVEADYKKVLAEMEPWFEKRRFIAVGEIGTDLYWDKTYWAEQQDAFNVQCGWGLKYGLPVVIHCRETIDQTIALVRPWAEKGLTGVFHCFTGSVEQAKQVTDMGFFLGLGGVVTFKNGGMDTVVPYILKQKAVLETDSPYLAPAPHRGKRNEPANLLLIAQRVAGLWGMELEDVQTLTTFNARKLFRL